MNRKGPPPSLSRSSHRDSVSAVPSRVDRVATVAGAGLLAAAACSVPAAVRAAGNGEGTSAMRALAQWVALAGLLSPLAAMLIVVFRGGRQAMRRLFARGEPGALVAAAFTWWLAVQMGVLAAIGAGLRATTHHRGLAGATAAVAALASGLVMATLAYRWTKWLGSWAAETHRRVALRLSIVAAVGALFAGTFLVVVRALRSMPSTPSTVLIDVVALVGFSAIGASRAFMRSRFLMVGGLPAAAGLGALAVACLRAQPDLPQHLAHVAPLHAWVLRAIGL